MRSADQKREPPVVEPVQIDERVPIGIGLLVWVVAAIVLGIVPDTASAAGGTWPAVIVAGVAIGLVLLAAVYVHRWRVRRRGR